MRVPSCVTTTPFTATRPALIISSAARRDDTPAWASTFCRRTPSATGRWGLRGRAAERSTGAAVTARRTDGGRTSAGPLAGRAGRGGRDGSEAGAERGPALV